ncbi:MAG: DNA-directed RNA polymerase subunit alpha [Candidatus Algichlamydia australiensis]|nr:DNA-directed RNA polymerase subunit alpha [Chlamydiales bacterium]
MTVKYGKFELPTKIKKEKETNTYGKFIAEPFERGYGHTIGNGLRRILLTSLEAPAIVSIKIEGVSHGFMAIEGVVEDMTHIILNFKEVLLKKHAQSDMNREPTPVSKTIDVTDEMIEKSNGGYEVTVKDIFSDDRYELVNPDHKLFTVTKPMTKRIDLKVAISRGYTPSERQDIPGKVVDEIVLDAIFSPVRLVNYHVENTRVLGDVDFDRLILEITTDGRITPQEALSFATQIGIHHFECFQNLKYQTISFEEEAGRRDSDREELLSKLSLKINEIELSVRSTNCLSQANIETIGELVVMPEMDMLKFRNFGKKSLHEIKDKLEEMGLYLGMDLSKFDITQENVAEIIAEYRKNNGASAAAETNPE